MVYLTHILKIILKIILHSTIHLHLIININNSRFYSIISVLCFNDGYWTSEYGVFYPSDVDECTAGTDNCTQNCDNTDGSYTCSCDGGYTTTDNGMTCDGIFSPHFKNHFENDTTFYNSFTFDNYH